MNSYNTPLVNKSTICPNAPNKVLPNNSTKETLGSVKRQLNFT